MRSSVLQAGPTARSGRVFHLISYVRRTSELCFRWMNGQHLRGLPVEELSPMVGSALVEAGVCKDAEGALAKGAASLLQGSLELVTDAVSQTHDVLGYKVTHEPSFTSFFACWWKCCKILVPTNCRQGTRKWSLELCPLIAIGASLRTDSPSFSRVLLLPSLSKK